MSDTQQPMILLGRALQLLVNEVSNKEKQLKALDIRTDLSPDFKEFLIEKIKRENNEIASLCCAIDSISPSCTPHQQAEFNEREKLAIEVILTEPRICEKVAALHGKKLKNAQTIK